MAPTVLLIEDDRDAAEIYRAYLAGRGMRVLHAADGEAGLQCVHQHEPDLVVLDIAIPRVSGWTVARRIRSDPSTRRIPVLAVTALGTDEDRARAERLGLDGFFVKPIEPSRLYEELRRFLDLPPA